MAPMPIHGRSNALSVRFNCRSGAAASASKRSGLFLRKSLRVMADWPRSCHCAIPTVNHNLRSLMSIESPGQKKRNPRVTSSAFTCGLELSLGPDGHAVFRLSDGALDVLDRAESPTAFVVCGGL